MTFANQKGIDDHYKDPKCLKVQQLKQDMKKKFESSTTKTRYEKNDNIPTETEGPSMSLLKNSNHQIYLYSLIVRSMVSLKCKKKLTIKRTLIFSNENVTNTFYGIN